MQMAQQQAQMQAQMMEQQNQISQQQAQMSQMFLYLQSLSTHTGAPPPPMVWGEATPPTGHSPVVSLLTSSFQLVC